MPLHGLSNDKVIAFKLEVNLLLGETLVMAAPPKPQVCEGVGLRSQWMDKRQVVPNPLPYLHHCW